MFGLLSRSPRKKAPVARRPMRLGVRRLEARDCPAAPLSLSAVLLPGHQVQLSGYLMEPNPANATIMFYGAAAGSTTTDGTGHYSFTTSNAQVGMVMAQGVDQQNNPSTMAMAQISDTAPTVALSISYGSGRTVTLTGNVTDIDPGGRTVNFSGVVTGSVVTNADGSFSLTAQASRLGMIQATTTDLWQQTSNMAMVVVADPAPVITNFGAVEGPNREWTFTGTVTGRNVAGMTVTFDGLPTLNGETATVNADGTFTLNEVLQPGEGGMVSCQTTDAWGQVSNSPWDDVVQM